MNMIQKQVSDIKGFAVHNTNAKRSLRMVESGFQSPGGKNITDRLEFYAYNAEQNYLALKNHSINFRVSEQKSINGSI